MNKGVCVQKLYKRSAVAYLLLVSLLSSLSSSQTAMGVVDTVMAGAVNATEMSAVAVGTSIWLPTIFIRSRYINGIDPHRCTIKWFRTTKAYC